MRAIYIITDSSVTLDQLFKKIEKVPNDYNIFFKNQIVTLEISSPFGKYEYLKVEEETFESLLDEWDEKDEIFDILLRNPIFHGVSHAFYLTFSHIVPDCEILKYLIQSLVASQNFDFIIYDCMNSLFIPSEFQEMLNS